MKLTQKQFPSLILFCFTQHNFILKTIISYFRYQLIVCNTIHICLPNSTCLGHCKAMKRGSSSRRKCIITAVKARLAEEQNMHQVSMALRAFFTREMRTSQSKRKKPTTRWSSHCSVIVLFCSVCMDAFPKEGSGYPIRNFASRPEKEQTFLLP